MFNQNMIPQLGMLQGSSSVPSLQGLSFNLSGDPWWGNLQGINTSPLPQGLRFNLSNGSASGAGIGFGFNMPTAQLGLGILSSLGGLWSANNMNRLARDQFNYTRQVTDRNLRNQIQSYNTALEDRIRSRMVAEGRPMSEGEEYLERHRLAR